MHVKYLVDKGYSVLMYDFRNHGNSATGTCKWVTWGPEEAKDVLAAVDFVATHSTYKDAQIGLLSICYGCRLDHLCLWTKRWVEKNTKTSKQWWPFNQCVYIDFVKALGLPGFLQRWVNTENNKRVGFDMTARSFKEDVEAIPVPTLLVQNDEDEYLNKASINEFYDSLSVEKDLLWLSGIGKKNELRDTIFLTKNPEKFLYWFDKYMI